MAYGTALCPSVWVSEGYFGLLAAEPVTPATEQPPQSSSPYKSCRLHGIFTGRSGITKRNSDRVRGREGRGDTAALRPALETYRPRVPGGACTPVLASARCCCSPFPPTQQPRVPCTPQTRGPGPPRPASPPSLRLHSDSEVPAKGCAVGTLSDGRASGAGGGVPQGAS